MAHSLHIHEGMKNTDHQQPRNRADGRYSFDGRLNRLCVCGHTLGQHLAEAPHSCDGHEHDGECACAKFQPAK